VPWSLADKIEVLNAANSIEAKPHCTRQKHSIADEPITARIGRRAESIPASDSPIESDVASDQEAVRPKASTQDSPGKPPMTFQKRIILERQLKSDGPPSPDEANKLGGREKNRDHPRNSHFDNCDARMRSNRLPLGLAA
jgi:hypothetical protein